MHDLIELFGIEERIFDKKHSYIINKTTNDPEYLKDVVD